MTEDSSDVAWLDQHQQRSWRAFLVGTTLLMDRLDRDLREQHRLSLPEYEILVRLAEAEGNRMRMANLADSVSHSRSRVTHTVSRMETAGLVARDACLSDGRGVEAVLTDQGRAALEAAAPTHVAGVRQFMVDLVDEDDFEALGRVFDAVTDRLIEANPAMDIR
ncbi:MarR family transcriptional regulator [Nocardioides panacis]|uniref:MarR family transcriptional regulator n=1 Tax=Nocardioides panacis TaxID=2849501 RepID=A0A975SVH6_9ACTN|nr:MarR family transcriptional regulator [Nocardioides panacis]QWZ06613.1 MarR family transcriptional regulator [Nocardioides panacis]